MLLNEQWKVKKSMTNLITNTKIDEIYDKGISSGALGKLLGAGGGGFIVFFVPPEKQERVKVSLKAISYVPFKFEFSGSQVVYYSQNN